MVPSFDDSIDVLSHVQRRKLLPSLLHHDPPDDTPDSSLTSTVVRRTGAWFTSESNTTPGELVTPAVAEVKPLGPTVLPLYGALDPDALHAPFRDDDVGFMESGHAGCPVTVRSDGRVIVRPAETRAR